MKSNKITEAVWFKISSIICCMAVTAFVLDRFAKLIQHLVTIKYDWQFELLMLIGMLFFQYPFIYKQKWSNKLDYYFNMLVVSFFGAILLLPLLVLNQYCKPSDTFNLLYFFMVVLLMFFDHKRRVVKLQLPAFISYTWVLYRVLILVLIL